MILGDYYALHRHPFTGEPLQEPVWTTWDYVLVNALQLIEDFSDGNGIVVWEKESESVIVEAVKRIDPFEAAKERTTSRKNYKHTPGEYFVPRLKLHPQVEEWPTFQEWIDSQITEE